MPLSNFMQLLRGQRTASNRKRGSKRHERGTGRSGQEVIEQEPQRIIESMLRNNRLSQSTIDGWRSREDAKRGIITAMRRDSSLSNLYETLPSPKNVDSLIDTIWKVQEAPTLPEQPQMPVQRKTAVVEVKGTSRQHAYFRARPVRWSKEEREFLSQEYATTPNQAIANKLGRTLSAVESKAHDLRLKKASRTA